MATEARARKSIMTPGIMEGESRIGGRAQPPVQPGHFRASFPGCLARERGWREPDSRAGVYRDGQAWSQPSIVRSLGRRGGVRDFWYWSVRNPRLPSGGPDPHGFYDETLRRPARLGPHLERHPADSF